jgi:hypothetical protein
MKRLLIATLILACLALTQGQLIAGLLDLPAAVSVTEGVADPNAPINE